MKTFTMITRHGNNKDSIQGYTLMSSDYQTITVDVATLMKNISSKKIVVNNMAVEGGRIVSTNGALDKYTFINTANGNQVEGTARAVVLDRVEKNGKLVGYTVFTQKGNLAEANVADVVELCNKKLVANGKIKHTQDGDIVSAIGGSFNLREIPVAKAPKGEIKVDIMFFAKTIGAKPDYFGAIIACTSAAEMLKISDVLTKSNASVMSSVVKVAGQSVRDSLAIKRFGTNGIYGVFSTEILDKLIESNAIINNMPSTTVSIVKYNRDMVTESKAKMSNKMSTIEYEPCGDAATDKEAKEYAERLQSKYAGKVSK